jgi:hypothetical protein
MFSVIIPTMWRFDPFCTFLEDLIALSNIGEVIIINNDKDKTPQVPVLRNHKIKMWYFDDNIGVNPAWNYGVSKAYSDKIAIVNDDIIFDLKLFSKIEDLVTPDKGVYGICPGEKLFGQTQVSKGLIDFVPTKENYSNETHFGFGQLMIMNKKNWIPIPDGLKIYWGDNFIYMTQLIKTRCNYMITDMFHYTPCATTTSQLKDTDTIIRQEGLIYRDKAGPILESLRNA